MMVSSVQASAMASALARKSGSTGTRISSTSK